MASPAELGAAGRLESRAPQRPATRDDRRPPHRSRISQPPSPAGFSSRLIAIHRPAIVTAIATSETPRPMRRRVALLQRPRRPGRFRRRFPAPLNRFLDRRRAKGMHGHARLTSDSCASFCRKQRSETSMPELAACFRRASDRSSAAPSSRISPPFAAAAGPRPNWLRDTASRRPRPGQHAGGRFQHSVVAVAHHAAAAPMAGKHRLVRALVVEILHQHVARAAHGGDGGHPRRRGAVVAVAGCAGRRGEVARFASASQCTLFRYSANWLVGILYFAMCCGSAWQRAQVPGSPADAPASAVLHFPDAVHAVAVRADRRRRRPGGDALAVHAGQVLRVLVHSLLRRVLVHQVASLWQRAQSFGTAVRAGLPMKPRARLMDACGSSTLRSPPWQSAQLKPWRRWTSPAFPPREPGGGPQHGMALDAGVLGGAARPQRARDHQRPRPAERRFIASTPARRT